MSTLSRQPRRQRKAVFTAHAFERRKRMALPLSRELRQRYGRRQLPVRKGDTVRVLSGSYQGREERVAKIDRRSYSLTLDNVTGKTADAKLKALPIRPSHLVLTRLNLSDAWRRRVLNVVEAAPADEGAADEEAGPPTAALDEAESSPATPAPAKTPKKRAAKPKEADA